MATQRNEIVFVDTNILFRPDKKELVCTEFKEFIEEYSKEFDFKLKIPDVVKGELKYQHVNTAQNKL